MLGFNENYLPQPEYCTTTERLTERLCTHKANQQKTFKDYYRWLPDESESELIYELIGKYLDEEVSEEEYPLSYQDQDQIPKLDEYLDAVHLIAVKKYVDDYLPDAIEEHVRGLK
jgi:hypothetical protein